MGPRPAGFDKLRFLWLDTERVGWAVVSESYRLLP